MTNLAGKRAPAKQPVRCLNDGVVYESTWAAAKALGLSQSNVSHCINGVYAQTLGFRFEKALTKANEIAGR